MHYFVLFLLKIDCGYLLELLYWSRLLLFNEYTQSMYMYKTKTRKEYITFFLLKVSFHSCNVHSILHRCVDVISVCIACEPHCENTCPLVRTSYDINCAVQPQKIARGFKFRTLEVEG